MAAAAPAVAAAPASSAGKGAAGAAPAELAYTFDGSVELATPELADAVRRALDVDAELSPGLVTRRLSADGRTLRIEFAATELRLLRAATGTFYDLLALAVRAAERFGPGGSDNGGGTEARAGTAPADAATAAVR